MSRGNYGRETFFIYFFVYKYSYVLFLINTAFSSPNCSPSQQDRALADNNPHSHQK